MIDLLYAYETYLIKIRLISFSTVSSYMHDLRLYSDWIIHKGELDILTVTEQNISRYLSELREQGEISATVSRILVRLTDFYAYLMYLGFLDHSPVCDMPHTEKGQRKQILTSKEVERLLAQPACVDAKGYRDKAMLEVMCAAGIRASEIINLNVENVDLEHGVIRFYDPIQMRIIPLYPAAMRALSAYLQNARNAMVIDPNEKALFVNIRGDRMTRQGFWKIIKYYQLKAGIKKDASLHTLRHSFMVYRLDNGISLDIQMGLLVCKDDSHNSINVHTLNPRLKSVYERCHPNA